MEAQQPGPRGRFPFTPTRVAAALSRGLRIPRQALGIASLSLFGAEGGAWAQQPVAAEPADAARGPGARRRRRVQDRRDQRGTRTETPLRDIPQFINTVPAGADPLAERDDAADALRNVPGITTPRPKAARRRTRCSTCAASRSTQDIFIDGVRDLGEYNRDLFATESVEVLKGPSALHVRPRLAPAASINQTSKSADRVDASEVGAHVRLVRPEAR